MYPSIFYGYFHINLIRPYMSRKNLHKDHFELIQDSIKLYHIKGEEL